MEQYWCVISRYSELNIINGIVHKFDKYLTKGRESNIWEKGVNKVWLNKQNIKFQCLN